MSTENPYPPASRLEVVAHLPDDAHFVLDVGCNTGAFGNEVKRRRPGTVVWGQEPRVAAAAAAAQVLDHVVVGEYPAVNPVSELPFDCIVFNDVLEHMPVPEQALQAARSSLTAGGCVVAVVPNVRYIRVVFDLAVRGRWTYTETGILDRTHLRFFTRRSLADFFESNGFTIDEIVPLGIFGERFGITVPQRLLLRGLANGQILVVARPA